MSAVDPQTSTKDKQLSWQHTTNPKVRDHGTGLLYLLCGSTPPSNLVYSTRSFSTPCPGLSQKHFASHFATLQAYASRPHHVDPYLLNNSASQDLFVKIWLFYSSTLMKVWEMKNMVSENLDLLTDFISYKNRKY